VVDGLAVIALLLLLLFAVQHAAAGVVQAQAPAQPEVTAASAIVVDADTGLILYEKNASERRAPASLTKLFTALAASEQVSADSWMTVSEEDLVGEASAGLWAGQELTFADLLHGMLLPSGNDAAQAISRNVGEGLGGSGEVTASATFMAALNQRLPSYGATGTRLANPHGLDEPGHYSTARDLATTARYLLTFAPEIVQVLGTGSYENNGVAFANTNRLLLEYPGLVGGKTGLTDAAGYCLLQIATRDDTTIITVLFGSSAEAWYADAEALLDYGFSAALTPALAGQSRLTLPGEATTLVDVALEPARSGLVAQSTGTGAYVVQAENGEASNPWSNVTWPFAALSVCLVTFVVAVQWRALRQLRVGRPRRGARSTKATATPSLSMHGGETTGTRPDRPHGAPVRYSGTIPLQNAGHGD
jgi:D-alanyl-D-alanine carboxypeptidase (penicillin-binding protein 5/6)